MIKLIEDIFFTEIIAHKAFSQGPDTNQADIYSRNEKEMIESRNMENGNEEVKISTPANKPNGESRVMENIKDVYYR